MDYTLNEIFDIKELESICKSFTDLTGNVTAILDLDGKVHVTTGWHSICTQFHRANGETRSRCLVSDTILAGQINKDKKYSLYKCKNGLIDVAMPIVIHGTHVANFFTGQFLLEKPDIEYFRKQAKEFGFDEKKYLAALESVPVYTEKQIEKNTKFLVQLAETIGNIGLRNLKNIEINKKLRQSEEELKASNQQLQASEQQLEANNQQLIASEEKLSAIINNSPFPAVVVDNKDYEILFWSKSALELFGHNPKTSEEWYELAYPDPEYRQEVVNRWKPLLGTIQNSARSVNTGEYKIHCKNGTIKICEIHAQFIQDNLIIFLNDITDRKKAELEIKEKSEQLETIIKGANLGWWDWDIPSGEEVYNDILVENLGYKLSEITPHIKWWEDKIHPDDFELVTIDLENHFNGKTEFYKNKHRLKTKAGHWRWFLDYGKVVERDSNGKPIRMIGTLRDIDYEERAKEKINDSLQQIKVINANTPNIIWKSDIDEDGSFKNTYISGVVDEFLALPKGSIDNSWDKYFSYVLPEYLPSIDQVFKDGIGNLYQPISFDYEVKRADGKLAWFSSTGRVTRENKKLTVYGTTIDITQKKQNELELIKAKKKAEESEQLKSAFLANMSHEIRTPMNGILGFTNLLKEPELSGEDQERFIEIIRKSGERMLNTVNDIIDISKIDARQVEISNDVINISEEIKIQYEFFKEEAKTKGIEMKLKNELLEHEASIVSDENKLNSIISNLVKNAVKYTDKGSIEIRCIKKESNLEISITDTGIGIPESRIQSIFNRFEQADISDTRAHQGSGLGLSIAKAYAEMLNGSISVESEPGAGSTFYLTFPWIGKDKKPERTKEKESINNTIDHKLNILIAEDDDSSFEYLKIIVNNIAKSKTRAYNGKEVVEYLKNHKDVDLILMDIKMPVMDGYEAAKEIRKFNKNVIIIAQTADALEGDKEKSLAAGCNDYISKPINRKLLFDLINIHLAKRTVPYGMR